MKSTSEVLMSRLRMKQLQLLIALDEHQSLNKASSAMAMTQSAASKALAEVESMLDATLFERTKRGLVPNQFGRAVIRYARVLGADVAALCDEVAQIRSGTGGRLAVGVIMGAVSGLVAPVVGEVSARYPGLAIEIVEDTSARMLALLDDGRLDLVVGRVSVSNQPRKYTYQAIAEEPLSVVVGFCHPRPSVKPMRFSELEAYRWITYTSSMPMNELLSREMDLAGLLMPENTISTSSTFVTIALLQQSKDLISILPASVAELFARQRMVRILPVELKSRSQTFGVVTRKDGHLSTAARHFVQVLRQRRPDAEA
jgi:DNA-binding transcriptional LysR family regulator